MKILCFAQKLSLLLIRLTTYKCISEKNFVHKVAKSADGFLRGTVKDER